MAAAKIDGTALAKKIRASLRTDIEEKQKSNPRFKPCLKIIQGKHHADSTLCVRIGLC